MENERHEPTSTNVNATAVEDLLNERLGGSRTPVEAAGEVLLLKDKQQGLDALSSKTKEEIEEVVGQWLAKVSGLTESGAAADLAAAALYARFLGQRVTFELASDPTAQIDEAWREWRALGS